VLATQNPIEQEGTYPLPAAQLDRFTFMINVDYPARAEEYRIVRMTTAPSRYEGATLLSRQDILDITRLIATEPAPASVVSYATELARLTRPKEANASEGVRKYLAWGVGPRGAQCLVLGAKVRAIIKGRNQPTEDDVRALLPHVFRHRMILSFAAEAEGISADQLLGELMEAASPAGSARPS
jgi:MoxR-like ATPase